MSWLSTAKWVGTVAGVSGALMIAFNLGIVAHGFALFLVSSLLWGAVGLAMREPTLVLLQATFTVINLIGLWRWTSV